MNFQEIFRFPAEIWLQKILCHLSTSDILRLALVCRDCLHLVIGYQTHTPFAATIQLPDSFEFKYYTPKLDFTILNNDDHSLYRTLDENFFTNYVTKIQTLTVTGNINLKALECLPNLASLTIHNNRIAPVDFPHLPKVTRLKIVGPPRGYISYESSINGSCLPGLEFYELEKCSFNVVYIKKNSITHLICRSIDEGVSLEDINRDSLVSLKLYYCTWVGDHIVLPQVTHCQIVGTIWNIPEMPSVKKLRLVGNFRFFQPGGVWTLDYPSLEDLTLMPARNWHVKFVFDFTKLTNLRQLSIGGSGESEFQCGAELPQLEHLAVSNTVFEFPPVLTQNLKTLFLLNGGTITKGFDHCNLERVVAINGFICNETSDFFQDLRVVGRVNVIGSVAEATKLRHLFAFECPIDDLFSPYQDDDLDLLEQVELIGTYDKDKLPQLTPRQLDFLCHSDTDTFYRSDLTQIFQVN